MKLSLYIYTVFFVAKVEVRQLIVQCGVELELNCGFGMILEYSISDVNGN